MIDQGKLKYFILLLFTGAFAIFYSAPMVLADNVRPAYLDIEEFEKGSLRILWKVPRFQSIPERFEPAFPETFKIASPKQRIKSTDAIIEKWTMVSNGEGITGASIGIVGLNETTMDALVRIQLADGSLQRAVLRPTETAMVVSGSTSPQDQSGGVRGAFLRSLDHWRYYILFCAAWLLGLMPSARRRGILLCALALIAGSVCGHALGGHSIHDKLFNPQLPSEMETKRIVRGLMLNTYRAFILEADEEIYDALSRSVAGEFLNEVYLQNKEALRINAADGAFSIVDRLDVKSFESLQALGDGTLEIVAHWDVYGSVSHQNHVHFRCNTYKAKLTLTPTDDYWKLTDVQLLDEERVI